MTQEQSPVEKARILKEKALAEPLEQEQNQKSQKRLELKTFIDEQIKIHQEEMGGIDSLKQEVKKVDTNINEGKKVRTSKKSEAKEVANILRDEKGKLNIKANEEIREIFAPIIKSLKDINEQVKIERQLKETTSKELDQKRKVELERAFTVLRKFKEEHPELVAVRQKKESNEKSQQYYIELNKKLENLRDSFAPYLHHKVGYDTRLAKLKDITALKRMEELDKIIKSEQISAEAKIKALREEVDAYIGKGKSFFQSNKSFDKKCEELRKNQKEQEKTFWADYTKAWDEKTPLRSYLYDLDKDYNLKESFGRYTEDLEKYINQEGGVTFEQLFDEAQKRNQARIDKPSLDEDEALLKEIADALENNENEARRI